MKSYTSALNQSKPENNEVKTQTLLQKLLIKNGGVTKGAMAIASATTNIP